MQKPLGQYRVCLADQGQSISSSLALSWFKSKMLCCSDTAAPSAQPSPDVLGAHFRLCRKRRNESLRTWVNKERVARREVSGEPVPAETDQERLRRLEKENRELRMKVEFLGKATAFFAREYR